MYLTIAVLFAAFCFVVGCFLIRKAYRDQVSRRGNDYDDDLGAMMATNTVISLVLGGIWVVSIPLVILAGIVYLFYYKWFKNWVKRD